MWNVQANAWMYECLWASLNSETMHNVQASLNSVYEFRNNSILQMVILSLCLSLNVEIHCIQILMDFSLSLFLQKLSLGDHGSVAWKIDWCANKEGKEKSEKKW
jgi:hypothetical protein